MSEFKRLPAVYRKILNIKQDDIRVKIIGKTIDKSENMLILDDGTGRVDLVLNAPVNISIGDTACAFTRINGNEYHAEIIQNMNGLDLELFRKVFEG